LIQIKALFYLDIMVSDLSGFSKPASASPVPTSVTRPEIRTDAALMTGITPKKKMRKRINRVECLSYIISDLSINEHDEQLH
jgi:hypothetical protein